MDVNKLSADYIEKIIKESNHTKPMTIIGAKGRLQVYDGNSRLLISGSSDSVDFFLVGDEPTNLYLIERNLEQKIICYIFQLSTVRRADEYLNYLRMLRKCIKSDWNARVVLISTDEEKLFEKLMSHLAPSWTDYAASPSNVSNMSPFDVSLSPSNYDMANQPEIQAIYDNPSHSIDLDIQSTNNNSIVYESNDVEIRIKFILRFKIGSFILDSLKNVSSIFEWVERRSKCIRNKCKSSAVRTNPALSMPIQSETPMSTPKGITSFVDGSNKIGSDILSNKNVTMDLGRSHSIHTYYNATNASKTSNLMRIKNSYSETSESNNCMKDLSTNRGSMQVSNKMLDSAKPSSLRLFTPNLAIPSRILTRKRLLLSQPDSHTYSVDGLDENGSNISPSKSSTSGLHRCDSPVTNNETIFSNASNLTSPDVDISLSNSHVETGESNNSMEDLSTYQGSMQVSNKMLDSAKPSRLKRPNPTIHSKILTRKKLLLSHPDSHTYSDDGLDETVSNISPFKSSTSGLDSSGSPVTNDATIVGNLMPCDIDISHNAIVKSNNCMKDSSTHRGGMHESKILDSDKRFSPTSSTPTVLNIPVSTHKRLRSNLTTSRTSSVDELDETASKISPSKSSTSGLDSSGSPVTNDATIVGNLMPCDIDISHNAIVKSNNCMKDSSTHRGGMHESKILDSDKRFSPTSSTPTVLNIPVSTHKRLRSNLTTSRTSSVDELDETASKISPSKSSTSGLDSFGSPDSNEASHNASIMQYTHTQKGNKVLLYEGYEYTKFRENSSGVMTWRCKAYFDTKCKAKLKTRAEIIIGQVPQHCHDSNPQKLRANVLRDKMKQAMKVDGATPKNVMETYLSGANRDVLVQIPKKSSVLRNLYKHKGVSTHNPDPSTAHFAIPEKYAEIILYDTGANDPERILAVGSRDLVLELKKDLIYGDGTFDKAPEMFIQLYTWHAKIGNLYPPCLYFLLKNNNMNTYNRMFGILKELVPKITPQTILMDLEKECMCAARSAFPQAEVKGSYYHLCQSVKRKINSVGLKKVFESDIDMKLKLKSLPALSFVPIPDVKTVFDQLVATFPDDDKYNEIQTYFQSTFIQGDGGSSSVFQINDWNHFEAVAEGCPKTINYCVEFHNTLNSLLYSNKLTIWKILDGLKKDTARHLPLLANTGRPQVKKRKRETISKQVQTIVQEYKSEDNTLDFLRRLANIQ